ncbi:MAG: phage tail sheath subtilisin-like domain-containing protein [Nocardioides sp.]
MTPPAAPTSAPLMRGRMTGRALANGVRRVPGVSVEWVGPLFRGIDALRSDVAGFVGLAARGPLDRPKRLESVSDFDSVYGPAVDGMLLAPAVHGFFANGGSTCWVARAAHRTDARRATGALGPGLVFSALNEGTWGNGITVAVQPAGGERVTITVRAPDGRRELWRNLDRDGLTNTFGDESTSAESASALVTLSPTKEALLPSERAKVTLEGGDDGLARLSPIHLSGDGTEDDLKRCGAALLADIDEISQIVVPDLVLREPDNPLGLPAHGPTAVALAQAQLVGTSELLGRTALLHHPDADARADEVVAWRQGIGSAYAAIHWPWLRIPDPGHPGQLLDCPPGGHVAGIVARSDLAAGPHKPPANELVSGAVGLTRTVDDESHGGANDAGVDVIRAVPGRGIRVMGARTTSNDSQWRYLNVRRLVTHVERSVAAYAGWLVFEPDDRSLRDDVERVVRRFLDDLWRAGALEGRTAAEGYSVHVEDDATSALRGGGTLVVEIGLQPPWPAEFVVVRIDVPDVAQRDTRGGGPGGDDR